MTGAEAKEMTGPTAQFASPPVVQYCMAVDRVRHVGEAVAAVVAENRYIAEDACDLIEVEYQDLPVVVDPEAAMTSSGDAVLHPERGPNNIAQHRTFKFGPVEDDFAKADLVVKRKLRWGRSGAQPLETVGCIASYAPGSGKFTMHTNSSFLNYVGWLVGASLGVPASKLNLIPCVTGGSFGSKIFTHKVMTLTGTLARAAGRPVKYMEDRIDNITSCDNHGSDRLYRCELALKRDGTMQSLRFQVIDDYGAYFQFGVGTHGNSLCQIIGPYRINSVQMELIAVLTNKGQQGAYRGFGSEVTNWMLERMADAAADELKMDPIELRRRNLIQPDQFPYVIPSGNVYDSGNYRRARGGAAHRRRPAVLEEALRIADLPQWRKIRDDARAQGRCVGIGIATCQERSVFSATEFWSLNGTENPGFTLDQLAGVDADPHRPDRRDPRHARLALLGQQPGDDGDADRRRAVPGRSVAGERRLCGHAERLQLHRPGRQPLHGDDRRGDRGRGEAGQGQAPARGRAHDGSRRGRPRVPRRQDRRERRARQGEVDRRGVPASLHYFRLNLPPGDDFASGVDATYVYDHPLTTTPAADRSHLGIFYPIMGHMCHLALVEVDPRRARWTR